MIPLYILGLLLRFGPQHGYQIKKLMEEQLEDFTQIKLPTVYYHLEKMKASGILIASNAKDGARPEKTVYSVSEAGAKYFGELLIQALQIRYRPTFEIDAAFYFSEHVGSSKLIESLNSHAGRLKKTLSIIGGHRAETLQYLPEQARASADIIFKHHILHYQAELDWAEQAVKDLSEEAIINGKNENN